MAVTADVVEVRLEANTANYVRNLNKADAAFNKTANDIVANTAKVDAAARTAQSSFSGVAAQFQDIGVTAAMGMNPLLIALQQGTQLSAQLQLSASRGQGVFKSLATGVAGLINPISVTTILAIALGTALIQSLGSVLPNAESASDALKRHKDEIDKIVDGYEGAEAALDDYFDKASRIPSFAASAQLRDQFDEIATGAEKFRQYASDIGGLFESVGSNSERELSRLARGFADGTISAEEFYRGLEDVESSMNLLERATSFLPGSLQSIIDQMRQGALAAASFGDAIDNLVTASHAATGIVSGVGDLQNALDLKTYIAEQERLNGLTADQLALEKAVAQIKKDAGEFGITDERALELAKQTLAAEKARADTKKSVTSGDKAAREYEREREAVAKLLEELGFEAALLGQSNREKAIAIALSKANATATDEERESIEQLAGFIYDTEQAIKDLNDSSQEWADTIQSATRGFIDDLIAGKDAAEAFSNVLSNIANKLIDVGLSNLFGTGGFNVAGLFGGLPTRATGGPVYAGNPTLVGERGPEVFIPSGPGRIVPNSQLSGGGSVVFAPNIDARGADVAAVARLEQTVQRMSAEIVPAIRREMATAGKKGRTRG